MKFNFKKITSVLASVIMLGSTMGIAAAANYPAPFISGGAADVAVIVTSGTHAGSSSDLLASVDIGQSLQAELAKQTASGGGATTTVSGEGVALSTGNTKIYYNDSLDKASSRATLDKTELPIVLADGTVTDDTGTDYDYTQKIEIQKKYVTYGTSGNDIDDPTYYIDIGTAQQQPMYNMTVTFTKLLNVTSSDVRGNTIKIFGKEYTIGSGSDVAASTPSLILFGAGETVSLNEGEETTVTIGGIEYSVKVVGVSSTGAASISVDGGTIKSVASGASSKIGALNIYVKSSFYSAKENSQNYAELSLGSEKITLNNATTVKIGSDDKAVSNSWVEVTPSTGKLSKVMIGVTALKSKTDDIQSGSEFVDPVFGSFKLGFSGLSEEIKAETRDHIVVDTDNTANARVTFTSALAGSEYTLNYAHDSDTSSTAARAVAADASNKTLHVLENESVLEDERLIVNSGDDGRILEVADISITAGGDPDDYITFTDVLCSSNCDHKVIGNFTSGAQTLSIGGEDYIVESNGTRVNVRWNSVGRLALFPRIKLAKGGWLAVLKETTPVNGTTFILPSGYETVTSETHYHEKAVDNTTMYRSKTYSNWAWVFENISATKITGLDIDGDSDVDCNFSAQLGPVILFLEEKKDGDTYGDAVCVPLTTTGTTELAIDTPKFSTLEGAGSNRVISWSSDTYKTSAVDKYGTYVERDTSTGTNNAVDIYYPDEQVQMSIILGEIGSSASTSTSSGTVTILGSVTETDATVGSVSGKNLIVIGGSCINSVAAKILGSDTPLCAEAFTAAAGVGTGQFLVKVVDSPYTTGKVAMLVAGYEAADTVKAVTYVTTEAPATAVGTDIKKVTTTLVDVTTSTE